MSRLGLIERFRERLPFAPEDPVVSLLEGSTPLLLAERVSERVGAEVWLKLEGANPTGSFKDRGMTCAVSAAVREGAEAVICASTGQHRGERGRLRGARGADGRGDRPRGQDRHGQARPGAHARRAGDRPARQLRPGAGARPRARRAPSHRARELGQPVPARGPEDGRLRDRGGARGDRRALHPRRQRRQHHRVLERLHARRAPGRACWAGRPRAPRRSCTARPWSRPRRWRARSGSAIPPAGRRRWAPWPPPTGRSAPSRTRRSSTPTASWPPPRACSASRPRRRAWRGCSPTAPTTRAAWCACSPGHGLKDPQTALGQAGSVVPCEPDLGAVERAVLG